MGRERPVRRRRRASVRWCAGLAVLAVVLSGCANVVSGTAVTNTAPDAKLKVIGDSGDTFDTQVKNALSDVIAFWKANYPKVSGGVSLPPLKGGLYSVDGAEVVATKQVSGPAAKEACIAKDPGFIVDNAAFCLLDDSIVWDRSPTHLVPVLAQHYGPLLVALVFAHEFGHAIQYRLRVDPNNDLPTIDTESQADCAAGAWVAAAFKGQAPHYRITPDQLDAALNGYLQVRDSTPESPQDISHGNGFDRISALADGIKNGVTYCYAPNGAYFHRTFTERPYTTDQDYAAGGNETLEQVLDANNTKTDPNAGGLQPDLNAFWKGAAASIHKSWQDVKIAEAAHPKCDTGGSSEFGYCPNDNTVYYNKDFAKSAYYSLTALQIDRKTAEVSLAQNQPADFALGTLFAIGWGLAVRHQLFGRSLTGQGALEAAICYTGAYAKSINDPNKTGFQLSPPDMDEATSAMLNLVGLDKAFGARGTSGLQRVQLFVKGYGGGLSTC